MQAITIYYGSIIIAAIFAKMSQKININDDTKKITKKIFWILSMMILVMTFGLRKSGVGVDDNNYDIIFKETAKIGFIKEFMISKMEPGYLLLNYVISLFTNNFQILIFITTLIPIFLYYKAIEYEENNINIFWAVFLLGTVLFIYFCGIIRLFIASSIIAYGLRFVIEKKTKKLLLILFLASIFHYSALFMVFLLYFSTERTEKKKSTMKLIILVSVIMPIIIIMLSQYVFPNMGGRYLSYTNIKNNKITLDVFDKVPFLILAFFFYKSMQKTNSNIRIYTTVFSVSFIISLASIFLAIDRIQWYCMFSICIILPSIYEVLKKVKKQEIAVLFIPVMIVYPILYSYLIMTSKTRQGMLLYQNIFMMIK